MNSIKDLKPTAIWQNFYKLTQVPRPSNHEEQARKFMLEWAKENNIEAEIDEVGNIIMRKPATPGMENRKGVILQGHLDMVPQKNEDIPHGPLEVLITATEETGMDGANGLKPGLLKGDILLNLDSETEGELYVGCAGGLDSTIEFNYQEEAVPADVKAFRIGIKGLKGGHSGMDINLGRGNSNKLLLRFLKTYAQELGIRVSTISGGSLRNAIPRESFAVIVLPAANETKLQAAIKEAEGIYKAELNAKEPTLQVIAEATEIPAFVIDTCTQFRLTNAVLACPNGTVRMIDSMPDTVETSNNLAIVQSKDGKIVINTLLRSSVETAKDALAQAIQAVFELAKADKILFNGAYPGWKPNPDSAILKEMQEIYEQLYGKKPAIMAVHAGLECGILGSKYPNWDMISFGPTLCSPHSPDERVNIASVEKFWEYLKATLKNIPAK